MATKTADSERCFTARDLRIAAGLSYRQLNTWDAKGILPASREASGAWRRFTESEVFVLGILRGIQEGFHLSLEALSRLAKEACVNSDEFYDWFRHRAAEGDSPLFVATDLMTFITSLKVSEFEEALKKHTRLAPDQGPLVLFDVLPILERVRSMAAERRSNRG